MNCWDPQIFAKNSNLFIISPFWRCRWKNVVMILNLAIFGLIILWTTTNSDINYTSGYKNSGNDKFLIFSQWKLKCTDLHYNTIKPKITYFLLTTKHRHKPDSVSLFSSAVSNDIFSFEALWAEFLVWLNWLFLRPWFSFYLLRNRSTLNIHQVLIMKVCLLGDIEIQILLERSALNILQIV